MDNKSDYQLLIIKTNIESKKKDYDKKTSNTTQDLTGIITSVMDQIKISKYSSDNKD